jgi:hypothetical protein
MASELERIVRLEARMERMESWRQRVIDMLPLVAVLALLLGQVGWLWGVFQGFDDRLDRVETRLERVETRLERVEARLERLEQGQAEILRRLPEGGR